MCERHMCGWHACGVPQKCIVGCRRGCEVGLNTCVPELQMANSDGEEIEGGEVEKGTGVRSQVEAVFVGDEVYG